MSGSTLGDRGRLALERTAEALGLAARGPEIQAAFATLSASWAGRATSEPVFGIHTPDASPLELSTPLGGAATELRFTVEPQAAPYGHRASWGAAVRTLEALRGLPGVALEPVERALVALEPRDDEGFGFALWLGAVFGASGPPRFKAYFNTSFAEANGTSWQELVGATVGTGPVRALEGAVGDPRQVGILSYDLVEGAGARVKLYVGHAEPGPREGVIDLDTVERVEALGNHARAGDARTLLETFLPEGLDPTSEVPVFVGSTVHLIDGAIDRVTTNACFLPFGPGAPPDAETLVRRAGAVARKLETTTAPLAAFLAAVAPSRTALTYLSVQREGDRPRLTAYASPFLYAP